MSDFIIEDGVLKEYTGKGGDVAIPDGVTEIEGFVFQNRKDITNITIPSGVTEIGYGAFDGCSKLMSVVIPDGVKVIGEKAFYGCCGLTSVTIPDSVKKIGIETFGHCDGLADSQGFIIVLQTLFGYCGQEDCVAIPDGVTNIDTGAFVNCKGLTSVTIPVSVTKIGPSAFFGCENLVSLMVDEKNKTYSSHDGVLFSKDKTKLILCPAKKKGEFIVPNGVSKIVEGAFKYCGSLTSITIPDGATTIGSRAFYECSSMTSITIPASVKKIEKFVFSDCSSLKDITISDGVTEIGEGAFSECSSLTSITIPASVKKIDKFAFSNCSSLKDITILDGVTEIGEGAFYKCSSLTNITIPASVKKVGKNIFSLRAAIEVNFLGNVEQNMLRWTLDKDGVLMIKNASIEDIPAELRMTAVYGFAKMMENGIDIEERVGESYKKYITSQCKNMLAPMSKNLALLSYALKERLLTIDYVDELLKNDELSVEARAMLMDFREKAFSQDVKTDKAEKDLGVLKPTAAELKKFWSTKIGYDGDLYITKYNGVSSEVEVPATIGRSKVTVIGVQAFYCRSNLKSVTISHGVTVIGDEAFKGCDILTSVTIPDSVNAIESGAFAGCSSLQSITIPASVKKFGIFVFRGCSDLTIHAPAGSKAIEYATANNIKFVEE